MAFGCVIDPVPVSCSVPDLTVVPPVLVALVLVLWHRARRTRLAA